MSIVKAENARKDIPLVSIIAVCYNHSRFVKETLDSILNQTYDNIELVIIDSNSPDNSVDVIENWINQNKVDCKFIKQTEQRNISQNLNEGIVNSNGNFIQVIATDDILLPSKIDRQIHLLQKNPKYDATFAIAAVITEKSELTGYFFSNITQVYYSFINNQFQNSILKINFIIHHSCLFRRTTYDKIGFYDEKTSIEDWDFFLRFFKQNLQMFFDPSLLCYYRSTSGSVWNNKTLNLFKEMIYLLEKNEIHQNKITLLEILPFFRELKENDFRTAMKHLKDKKMFRARRILRLYKYGLSRKKISKIDGLLSKIVKQK